MFRIQQSLTCKWSTATSAMPPFEPSISVRSPPLVGHDRAGCFKRYSAWVLWRSRSAWCQQVSIVSFLILQSRVEKEKTFFDVLMSKSGIRWKTREPQQILQDSARPGTKHTLAKSVTPKVILFRMFHTAACSACSLSACRMLMSVLNSLTLHDLNAYNPQPFLHVCPPLAIHYTYNHKVLWVWLIRQCIGLR